MRKPRKEIAYDYVLGRIASGEYPAGMRLSEVAMAQKIGVSPTPLREAYRQLASEGLLEHRPNAGVFVRRLEEKEIRELYELREAIESFSAGKATQWMPKVRTDQLQAQLDEMQAIAFRARENGDTSLDDTDLLSFLHVDESFHTVIIEASNNGTIAKIARDYRTLTKLMMANRFTHSYRQTDTTIEQHAKILDAIRRHNRDDAERLMKEHIRFSRDHVLQALQSANMES
jgi:DNA-binding GntR family transcriptional regulator